MTWQSFTIYKFQGAFASRRLKPWQEKKIVEILSPHPSRVDLMWGNSAEAAAVAVDYLQLFAVTHWRLEFRGSLPPQFEPTAVPSGIWIYRPAFVANGCSDTLYMALRAANIEVRQAIAPNLLADKQKCMLFVGDKPSP